MTILDKDFLIAGQLFTSRTETLEDYLLPKLKRLGVIGLVSCFLSVQSGRLSLYEKGRLKKQKRLFNLYIKDYSWYRRPLVIPVFLIYFINVIYSLLALRRKFDVFIGVACFSASVGVLLKKIGIISYSIYYCLDYYVPEKKLSFNSLFVKAINRIDRFVVNNSDVIWNLSPKITQAKEDYLNLKGKTIVVPLGYSSRLRREVPFSQINRWDVVFVGTITFNQGLQLLVSILPEILKKYPQLKVNIIGQGPFSKELIEMVKDKALDDYFIFHGFIEEEEKMLDIVAHSALGLAIWDDSLQSDHIKFADSGKPKLYALCGIPVIVSGIASIASEIERHKAGFVIKYNPKELTKTLDYLLKSDETLSLYRQNAASLGKEFTSEYIFDYAFQETAKIIDNLKK